LGNCASCHTEPGGTPYAGGRAIETPFGNVYAGNLTPSPAGLAGWNAEDFWGAMHHGQSRNGLLLYPAFPYPEFSRITREDSDALFAFLRTLSAVDKRNREHTLRFPFNTQAALRAWRWAYFTPQTQTLHPEKSVAWNRGSYLVEGLGHCATCHSPRNVLGGIPSGEQFKGGVLPAQKWLAPSLLSPDQAGVAHWPLAEVKSLLKNGVSAQAVVTGPMAEVVYGSTQFASDEDMTAIATYLRELPQSAPQAQPRMPSKTASTQRGAKLYEKQCAACHADNGEGAPGAYPALAGNRAVKQDNPTNLIRTLVRGGFAPATQGNPRPYGMPPFGHSLSNRDIADVLTFIRQHWENDALEVSELDVLQAR
jgi:mono/diheme cytochrome c family protein